MDDVCRDQFLKIIIIYRYNKNIDNIDNIDNRCRQKIMISIKVILNYNIIQNTNRFNSVL